MISERDIAEKFSVIWKQHFPLLTPNFMRVFNESQVRIINENSIPIVEETRYDLISETAFNLSEVATKKNKTPEQYIRNKQNLKKLAQQTALQIWPQGDSRTENVKLNDVEIVEICKLANNILEFIGLVKIDKVKFKPKLKGYGFIPDLVGDLSIDDTLYEIKTVTRNFKSSDIKQLLIYLALQQASENPNWKYAGLYNPRKGTYCKFNVKNIINNITGDSSPNETFINFLNSLVRDIQIDSKF